MISSVFVGFTFEPASFSAWISWIVSVPNESFLCVGSRFVELDDLEDGFELLAGGVTSPAALFKVCGSGDFPLGADLPVSLCVGFAIAP